MEGKWALASAGGGRVGRRGLGDICRSQRTRRKSLLTFPFFVLGSPLPIKSQFSPLAMDEASHSGIRLEREPTTVVLPAALIPVSARLFAIPCARGTAPQVGRVAMVADTLALNSSLESREPAQNCRYDPFMRGRDFSGTSRGVTNARFRRQWRWRRRSPSTPPRRKRRS